MIRLVLPEKRLSWSSSRLVRNQRCSRPPCPAVNEDDERHFGRRLLKGNIEIELAGLVACDRWVVNDIIVLFDVEGSDTSVHIGWGVGGRRKPNVGERPISC
jgi:hypothetical protein